VGLTIYDYQVIATGTIKGIECKNVFWYKADSANPNALELADEMEQTLLPAVATVLSSDFTYTELYTFNLVVPTDFDVRPLAVVGDRPSDSLPTFNSWYIRYFRPIRIIHDGRKSFAGIAENDVLDGVITSTLAVTMDLMTDVLQGSLDPGNGVLYNPCIAQTVEYTNPDTDKTYRIPFELWVCNRVEYVKVSTQNSRKR